MPNEKRVQQVAEYKEMLERAEAVLIVEYRGFDGGPDDRSPQQGSGSRGRDEDR